MTNLTFSNQTSDERASASPQGSGHQGEDPVLVQALHMTYPEDLQTQSAKRFIFSMKHIGYSLQALPVPE